MFGERVLFPYCPSFLGVWWKSPVSPLGCPGPCPLSLSIPVLPLIVIYCPVLSLYCPLLSFTPFIVHYYSLLSLYCPLLSLDCLFDIYIVLNCPSFVFPYCPRLSYIFPYCPQVVLYFPCHSFLSQYEVICCPSFVLFYIIHYPLTLLLTFIPSSHS